MFLPKSQPWLGSCLTCWLLVVTDISGSLSPILPCAQSLARGWTGPAPPRSLFGGLSGTESDTAQPSRSKWLVLQLLCGFSLWASACQPGMLQSLRECSLSSARLLCSWRMRLVQSQSAAAGGLTDWQEKGPCYLRKISLVTLENWTQNGTKCYNVTKQPCHFLFGNL